MRLIDADDLSFVLSKNFGNTGGGATLQRLIDIAPTVDPIKHGYWIPNTDDFTPAKRCQCCGYNKPEIAVCGGMTVHIGLTSEAAKILRGREPENYCPNCGAAMRADNETEIEP